MSVVLRALLPIFLGMPGRLLYLAAFLWLAVLIPSLPGESDEEKSAAMFATIAGLLFLAIGWLMLSVEEILGRKKAFQMEPKHIAACLAFEIALGILGAATLGYFGYWAIASDPSGHRYAIPPAAGLIGASSLLVILSCVSELLRRRWREAFQQGLMVEGELPLDPGIEVEVDAMPGDQSR